MTSDELDEIKREERAIERKRENLLADKREHETALLKIKNAIRLSGRMEDSKYKQYCNAQEKHVTAIAKIEAELRPLRHQQRELAVRQFTDRQVSMEVKAVETLKLKRVVEALVKLRSDCQQFAADHTRVSSMRLSYAQFTERVNEIIAIAIQKDGAS
jgi:hypothetical protein